MPSNYSQLKIQLMATGENSGTWGDVTNTNLGTAIEDAIAGYGTAEFAANAELELPWLDTNGYQVARNLVLNVTSSVTLVGTQNLVVPTFEKQYLIYNNTTGGQSITVKTAAGTGVVVPNGSKVSLYVDGTDVIPAINSLPLSATTTVKLPTTDGSNGSLLSTNGTGVLSWVQVAPGVNNIGYQFHRTSEMTTTRCSFLTLANTYSTLLRIQQLEPGQSPPIQA
jgi:hypothetical protein